MLLRWAASRGNQDLSSRLGSARKQVVGRAVVYLRHFKQPLRTGASSPRLPRPGIWHGHTQHGQERERAFSLLLQLQHTRRLLTDASRMRREEKGWSCQKKPVRKKTFYKLGKAFCFDRIKIKPGMGKERHERVSDKISCTAGEMMVLLVLQGGGRSWEAVKTQFGLKLNFSDKEFQKRLPHSLCGQIIICALIIFILQEYVARATECKQENSTLQITKANLQKEISASFSLPFAM